MKQLWTLALSLTLISSFTPWISWAVEEPIETELIESQLEPAKTRQAAESLRIEVNPSVTYELSLRPDLDKMKEALGLKIPEKVKKDLLGKGMNVEEVNPMEAFESLSAERRQDFHKIRLAVLTNTARILNSTGFVYGAGSLVGDGFKFLKIKALSFVGKSSQATVVSRSFAQRKQDAIQSLLEGIDYKLWYQAPLVIETNEFGFSGSMGIVVEGGMRKSGWGGSQEIGFSLAYNKSSRAFIFEIFHQGERFLETPVATGLAGIILRGGVTIARKEVGQETRVHRGSGFYPPAVPGFSTKGQDFFSSGVSTSLGLPPPPFADLLTYTNSFERRALIRVTISPLVKGFVRLQLGDFKGSFRLVAARFIDVYELISDKVLKSRRSCGRVFAMQ